MASIKHNFIETALTLAKEAIFSSNPNPRVGCVLVHEDGYTVLGQGHTQQVGGPHAEIMALRDAHQRGNDVRGATAYVTLEPCAHHGRTGPCADALILAGIRRVIASIKDPNPLVAGQGISKLEAAGIPVEVGPGAVTSYELNIGFFSRMTRKTPWVRLKAASSLDGVTALANGSSQWITSPAARADGHAWRARACAVLTGVGTVLADDPQLDVREVATPRQPHLVIVDSKLRTPPQARLFRVPSRKVIIYTAAAPTTPAFQALTSSGALLVPMGNSDGQVNLPMMLRDLALQHHVNELHVEAGHQLNGALLRAGLVDEMLVYLAPLLLGSGGIGLAQMGALSSLAEGMSLQFLSMDRLGPDIRLLARAKGSADLAPTS